VIHSENASTPVTPADRARHARIASTAERDFLADPMPVYRRELAHLISHLPESHRDRLRGRVRIRGRSLGIVHADSAPRRWRCRGYEIGIDAGWTRFVIDAVWLFLARTKVVSLDGTTTVDWDVSHAEAEAILTEAIGSYVSREPRWTTSPRLLEARRRRVALEQTLTDNRHRDWFLWALRIVRFTVAHELGHIVHDHFFDTSPGPTRDWQHEFEADAVAVEALVATIRSSYPPDDPRSYDYLVDRQISLESFDLVTSLGSMAIVFSLHDLIQRAARQLHAAGRLARHWEHTHPPARLRYRAFRKKCIEDCGVPVELFSHVTVGLPPPDHIQESLMLLALDLNWATDGDGETPPDGPLGPWANHQYQLAMSIDHERATHRRLTLDRLRIVLERAVDSTRDEIATDAVVVLVSTCLALSELCRLELDSAEESLIYCDLGRDYNEILNRRSENRPSLTDALFVERCAARDALGRFSAEERRLLELWHANRQFSRLV
jgi:hypothetical protein